MATVADRRKRRDEAIMQAMYGLEKFTVTDVATAAGGHQHYERAQVLVRERYQMGLLVRLGRRPGQQGGGPFVYRWVADE